MKLFFRLSRFIIAATTLVSIQAFGEGRYIDRSIHLLRDERAFFFRFDYVHYSLKSSSTISSEFFLDFNYLQPLDDELSLVWGPLPLGIRYAFPTRNPDTQAYVEWDLGLAHQAILGIRPEFKSFARKRISPNVAIDTRLHYYTFTAISAHPSLWTLEFECGPLMQYSDTIATKLTAGLALNDNHLRNPLRPKEPGDPTDEDIRYSMPVSYSILWDANPRMTLALNYSYRGLLINPPVRTHLIGMSVDYRW